MVVILVDEITNRVNYTFDFIFGIRGIRYSIVIDLHDFEKSEDLKLNYSKHIIDNIESIKPAGILSEDDIWKGELDVVKSEFVEYLSFDGIKDPIASLFYVLTRMEEYDCFNYDEHDRYPFSESILGRFAWIEKAMCDRWSEYVIQDLLKLKVLKSKGEFIPTFDIDNTFAYQLKTGKRKILSTLRDVLNFDKKRLKERKMVSKGGKDPYDTFDKIAKVSKAFTSTKVFWLTRSNGTNDRNIPLRNEEHRSLIKEVSKTAEVNIHPSYDSFLDSDQIQKERENLQVITEKMITGSRQHYLRFQLPESYRGLMNAGVKDDYTMGFAEHVGFRSGTARAHKWFDLKSNEITELTIHPFSYMDGTLHEYMDMTTKESKSRIKDLYDEVEEFGGDFIFIWHNETIGDYNNWNGWSEVLDFTLNLKNE